ncbi:putative methylated-DNA:protein-cysteine methyltransferase [Pilimelia terevasa]|uniref:Putative methylated-DNA:protein-cysteine methyltransferase n=1 Tax=Pilimelia terevasa TaxID=53372 RepID=A0A8J3BI81_9ACTN|nr:methylated-DNA--[protein]-cysteine S-methyltransferase [Pilimelia terevasa]GGK16579.1 putative methylated-DNA:protein-cysteine methyltransferase [Pilimelia terevasa]
MTDEREHPMTLDLLTVPTPLGPLTVLASGGEVRASGFTGEPADLLHLVHPALRGALRPCGDAGAVGAEVAAYFDGDLAALDRVRVRQRAGGDFMARAWDVMRDIRAGEPESYTAFAARAGRPAAVRAAAAACARNAAALFVPCHRVLRSDGSLGGYRWGTSVKTWLLTHETVNR